MTTEEKAYETYSIAYDNAWNSKDAAAAFKAEEVYKEALRLIDLDEIIKQSGSKEYVTYLKESRGIADNL